MDRCALFVDAGYVLAEGAMAVHGTRQRASVSWDYAGLAKLLGGLARDRTGVPLLRCYWYEPAADGHFGAEHEALADIAGLKVRLARMRPGRREGVLSEIHRDMTTLARNRAVSDAVIASAADDLSEVVAEVQDLGLRVVLVHIASGRDWTIPRSLRQECDEVVDLVGAHLRPFVELISGAEPSDHLQQSVVPAQPIDGSYSRQAVANGRSTEHPALPAAGSVPLSAAMFAAAPAAEYQPAQTPAAATLPPPAPSPAPGGPVSGDPRLAATQQVALPPVAQAPAGAGVPQAASPQAGNGPVAALAATQFVTVTQAMAPPAVASASTGQAVPPPAAPAGHVQGQNWSAPQAQMQGQQHGMQQAQQPADVQPNQARQGQVGQVQGQVQARQGYPGAPPEAQQRPAQQPAASPQRQAGPAQPGMPMAEREAPRRLVGPAGDIGDTMATGRYRNGPSRYAESRFADGSVRFAPASDTPVGGYGGPGYGGSNGAHSNGAAHGGYANGSGRGGYPEGPASARFPDGSVPTRSVGQGGGWYPEDARSAGYAEGSPPARFGDGGVHYPQSARGGYGADPGRADPGRADPGRAVEPRYGSHEPGQADYQRRDQGGGYGGSQLPAAEHPMSVSLAEAVQAAHSEGLRFGDAVARDAPALWLEAVLARKPRMPSDLEARLLQGSALPIDSLLHDEVRHSLRRGFWDALERSRR